MVSIVTIATQGRTVETWSTVILHGLFHGIRADANTSIQTECVVAAVMVSILIETFKSLGF